MLSRFLEDISLRRMATNSLLAEDRAPSVSLAESNIAWRKGGRRGEERKGEEGGRRGEEIQCEEKDKGPMSCLCAVSS